HPGKVILFGDLNEVRNDSERFGSIFSSGDAAIFNDFIQESGLIDLPIGVVALDRRWLDHNPILLHLKKFDFGPTPFRIFHLWFDRIDFGKVVKDKWEDITGEVLGLASDEDKSSRISKLQEIDYFERMNSLDLMQKARVKWEMEGNENSKFFQGLINSRRKSQSIHGIMHEGDLLEVVVSIKEIKTAVWDCGSNKAPGPDGYSFLFIKRFWDLLKDDIHEFVIVAKILSNRLSNVIDSIISHEQSAFVSSRQILDGPFFLSEIINWYNKRKKKLMLFKVDFEKAFDSVSWKYLDYMLHKMGFGSRWRTWINNCLMLARTSILINGSPTSEFSLKRGLRQGDHLSPFLFIIVMEGLHMALNDGIASNMFHRVRIGSNIHLSHLFYADNVIILSDWNQNDMEILQGSLIFSTSLPVLRLIFTNIMSLELEFRIVKLSPWLHVLVVSRFSLIVSRPDCQAPEMVIKSLGSLRANFFWGSHESSKKLSCVKWSNTLASFDKGGLGVGCFSAFNKVLLLKWRWRLFNFPNSLWVQVIKAFLGNEAGIDVGGCQTSGTWAKIIGTINHLHSSGIVPLNSIRFKVGNGSSIRFWKDT
nr:RNA-directed DNA polymerase, eukaryota, reverse transcriptase zinc-binding domain protein [Tanacetum cinerariifolium]